jgi:hypothetical protein
MEPAPERTELARLSGQTMAMLRVVCAARRESIGEVIDRIALDAIRGEYAAIIQAAASAVTARQGV